MLHLLALVPRASQQSREDAAGRRGQPRSLAMPWSAEVHDHRTRQLRRQARLEARGVRKEGDASLASVLAAAGAAPTRRPCPRDSGRGSLALSRAGAVAALVAWQREGHQLRAHGVERWPLVGPWLEQHLPRRRPTPAGRAGAAAAHRAKARPGPLVVATLRDRTGEGCAAARG